jgi:hypothetical protein
MSITVIVENDTIKLPAGVHLPDGTQVEITLPPECAPLTESDNALAGLAPFVGKIKTLPPDFAERHDEYIHGRKRSL